MYKNFMAALTSEEMWIGVGLATIKITAITILSMVVVRVAKIAIRKGFEIRMKAPAPLQPASERRYRTILRLVQSIVSYVVYFSAILAILSAVNIDVKGLLAGAGIVGLAVGFGAQSLVKDVITGFFIIFEDQFGVGDYIKITSVEGTVLEIGLRTTKIKGAAGEINIVPNGSITDVVNYSINNSIAIIDVSVAYSSDIAKAERLIEEYLKELPKKHEEITAPPTLLGVQNVVGAEVSLRISVETLPMQHFAISRMVRRDVKEIFDRNRIEIPYPKMMVYERDNNQTFNEEGER
ncbi:mechanosensitive ion channel family protein [Viridibacillus sp. FSL R5-0477]|nr:MULTISPECIES: mechanosensitive ion channel family protein [Viridibacillus]OMC81264.1 mechanosensitive ion channel protein MscS [Viridibacillus sp. FSL H8-0123]OMC85193.1 mechanosensitive ion channel protein MscS [Viridibacillus sp. FSL H7-0596]OMC90326.1 mechanosensitive ion channel protein MscS [Viridibacillus arenosi]